MRLDENRDHPEIAKYRRAGTLSFREALRLISPPKEEQSALPEPAEEQTVEAPSADQPRAAIGAEVYSRREREEARKRQSAAGKEHGRGQEEIASGNVTGSYAKPDAPKSAPKYGDKPIFKEEGEAAARTAKKTGVSTSTQRWADYLFEHHPAEHAEVVADQLRETPERADSWIAEDLGVSVPTVGSVRRYLAEVKALDLPEKVRGRDGKLYTYAERKKPKHQKPAEEEPEQPDGGAGAPTPSEEEPDGQDHTGVLRALRAAGP
jgi:hypothetical protein